MRKAVITQAVSYTHLDVYKRQIKYTQGKPIYTKEYNKPLKKFKVTKKV